MNLAENIADKITFAFNIFVLYFVWNNVHWSVALILTIYCFSGWIDKANEKLMEWSGMKE